MTHEHDATPTTAAERAGAARRRDALEINDSIVQGLTVIKYALELGDVELAERKTAETLAAARRVITDLLTQNQRDDTGHLAPGAMVRRHAASTNEKTQEGAA